MAGTDGVQLSTVDGPRIDDPKVDDPRVDGPVLVIVRDGWGRNPHPEHRDFDAVRRAETPVADRLLREFPWTPLATSGEDVGLPAGTMGNSEVGHQNLGAGRVVDQDSVRITKAIREGSFLQNEALVAAVDAAFARGGAVHLFGIASDAGVHGLLDHLYATLELCRVRAAEAKDPGASERVFVHLFTDGRDTGPFTGADYVAEAEERCREIGVGRIVSLCGRFWAMDRDNRWERIERAYDLLTGRAGASSTPPPHFETAAEAIAHAYENPPSESQRGDEFVEPRTVGPDPATSRVRSGDAVIFTNYRGDRPRELVRAFRLEDFEGEVPASSATGERGFARGPRLDLTFVTMTAYETALDPLVDVAFPKLPKMDSILAEVLSAEGLGQLRAAETEKGPHVTFFWNDYRDEPFSGERREISPSVSVATYDQQPAMSARAVADSALATLERWRDGAQGAERFLLVNFANADMVGHTGVLDAAIEAVETVDALVGELVDAVLSAGGAALVTADHGNAEQMWDPETDAPHTAHTLYPVDCVVVADALRDAASGDPDQPSPALRDDARLADVAPTVLQLLGLPVPAAMTGRSLFRSSSS